MNVDQTIQSAMRLQQAGRFPEAEQIYRQVLSQIPNQPTALHLLGILAYQTGRLDVAIDLFRQVIQLKPNDSDACYNLANALRDSGRFDESIASFQQAIQLNPAGVASYNNLANVLRERGRLDEAVAIFRQAIQLEPNNFLANYNLGIVLDGMGQLDSAIASYQHAIELQPDFPEAHINLANTLLKKGNRSAAIRSLRSTIQRLPNLAEAHANLGNALKDNRQLDEAIASFNRAIQLKPDYAPAYNNLGVALRSKGELDQALATFQCAIKLQPDFSDAHCNLGNALTERGEIEQAITSYRRAIQHKPDLAVANSNLLLTLMYHPGIEPEMILAEHRAWADRLVSPLISEIKAHSNSGDPERPLRIGYVSPDFRKHSVGYLVLPLLEHHDRTNFQIFCYSNAQKSDDMTERLKKHCDTWRNIFDFNDEAVAQLIRSDGIDILVDLSGHTSNNRLLVFARKPAPIQVTYLGYPNTTGMMAMDYRLSDALADPPGMTDALTAEKLWRVPGCAWCYQPAEWMPEIQPRPPGPIVFGCLNNFSKVNPVVLELWAKVLANNASSRLLLLAPRSEVRQSVLQTFANHGVDPARIELIDRLERQAYLQTFNRIDVSLDTYPYHGTVTTLESLWMGVPVVTLAGRSHVSRVGVSLLSHAGLGELVAESAKQYVRIATELANDEKRLTQFRSTLRETVRRSPVMDAKRHAMEIEAAYRQMWRAWMPERLPRPNPPSKIRVGDT